MEVKYKHKDVAFRISVDDIENSYLQLRIFCALKDVFQGFSVSDSDDIAMEFFFTDKIDSFIIDKEFVIKNTNRTVGTRISHHLYKKYKKDK